MSFEEYAYQMFMKYRLALALAVIKNKPENLSPEQYLAQLKEKVDQKENPDFDFSDNDFNFDDNDDSLVSHEFNNNLTTNKTNDDIASINLLQDFTNSSQKVNRNDVVEVSKNVIVSDVSTDGTNSLDEVLNTLRDIDENNDRLHNRCMPTQDNSQIIPSNKPNNHYNKHVDEESMTICGDISNDNIGFIDLVSKTDTLVTVDEKIRINVEKNINKRMKLTKADDKQNNDLIIVDNVVFKNTYDMEVDMALNDIRGNEHVDLKTEFIHENNMKTSKQPTQEFNEYSLQVNREEINKTVVRNNLNENLKIATTNTVPNTAEDTILYTLPDFIQNTSHISQSQCQNVEIPYAFIHGNRHKNITGDNIVSTNDDIRNINQGLSQTPAILTVNSNEIHYIIDQSGKTYAILQSTQLGKDNVSIDKIKETCGEEVHSQEVIKEHNSTNMNVEETSQKENTENVESLDIEDDFDKKLTDSEVVPFKVIKELSKIKAYLDRKERRGSTDDCLSDSGYRSDSQSSFKSARLSEDWVPQSAHCLYDYIVQCPLVAVTQDIVSEISLVLGRLIDRLYEEEKCPPFLEQLLDKVDELLREINVETECFEDILLDKDETIQRLLLLNKSTHILRFSIETITNVLEKIHSSLTSQEDLYELTSITEVENSRYIFYVLEIFLQMYVKNKNSVSQCSQSSQESKMLKKSSITEIWRKKWNPNFKETKVIGSQDKGCALTKCGVVLNKIIVDCMEGYSLVSFAALQCFNLLQS